MEPQLILTQQIQANVASIEQNLRYLCECLYDDNVSMRDKLVVIDYLFAQGQSIEKLMKPLFDQFRMFHNAVTRS